MRDGGRGPAETIFGVVAPGTTLGRTRLQKAMVRKLRKHRKESHREAMAQEKLHDLARSVKPFRPGFRKTSALKLGQKAQAMIKATATSKAAGLKRTADYNKAQRNAEKSWHDDAKATAAPFMSKMVTPKRTTADVPSNTINKLPSWALLGSSLAKKGVSTPASSSATPPTPQPSPHMFGNYVGTKENN